MRLEKCGLSRYVAGFDTPTIAEVADSIRDVYRSILNCDPFFEATIQELILEVTLGSRFKFTDVFWSVRDSRILERGEGLIRVVIRTAGVLVLPRVRRTINLI
jgi:hypothetical protein